MSKKPLHIVLSIGTPIEMPNYPIHLDGLLFWAIKDNSGADDAAVLARLDDILDKADGIYKASSMLFVRSPRQNIILKDINHATRTHWENWDTPLSKKVKTVCTKTGTFRKRLTTKNGILCEKIEFYAVGDADKIRHLLDILGFVGTSNRQGFGEIINIQVEECPIDQSWYSESGQLMRILPETLHQKPITGLRRSHAAFAPPYKTTVQAACVFPQFLVTTR